MKMIKNATAVLVSIAAVVAMTACSSDSGGGGTAPVATGGFIKTVEETGGSSFGGMFGTTDSRYQLLYTPTDLEGSGNIENISFQLNSNLAVDANCPNVTIKIGHTSLASLTTTYDANVEVGQGSRVTAASNVNLTIPSGLAGDYFSIPLDSPFNYNGVDNLVVEIVRDVACDTAVIVKGTPAAYNASLYAINFTAVTGTASTAKMHMKALFAGGENKIGQGAGNNSAPFSSSVVGFNRVQALYTSAEVNGSGPITGLSMRVSADVLAASTITYSINFGHTSNSDLVATWNDNFNVGSPVAVATSQTIIVPSGLVVGDYFWLPVPDGQFTYNGTDNLLAEIIVESASADVKVATHATSNIARIYGDPAVADATTLNNYTHDVKFRFNGATTDVITDGGSNTGFVFGTTSTTRQALYRATELGTAGKISKVSCRLWSATSTATDYANYKVTMGHTTLDQLTATFADNFDDATVVYNGNYSLPAGLVKGDWIEIPVTPFAYDGKRNLVIKFTGDGATAGHSCTVSSANAVKYPAQLTGNGDGTALTASVINDSKFDMRLWLEP